MGERSDSEEPPDLVDVENDGAGPALSPSHKVPITIITGKKHDLATTPTSNPF